VSERRRPLVEILIAIPEAIETGAISGEILKEG
jgi:hypothetical protein